MTVSLEFIATQMQRLLEAQQGMRDEMASMRSDIRALRDEVEHQRDEGTVSTGLVLRYAGEHIAWGGMQAEHRKLLGRVDALEKRPSR